MQEVMPITKITRRALVRCCNGGSEMWMWRWRDWTEYWGFRDGKL